MFTSCFKIDLGIFWTIHLSYPGIIWRSIVICAMQISRKRASTTGYSSFAECQGYSAKAQKHSGNCFAECNTWHTTHDICVSANNYLPSVFYRALGKWFAECQIWHSAKKSGLPSIFPKYTRRRIIVCRVFLELHSANLFSKEIFFSQHIVTVCRVFFEITLGKPIFQRKKNICRSWLEF